VRRQPVQFLPEVIRVQAEAKKSGSLAARFQYSQKNSISNAIDESYP
jgi:hypothetical protein